MTGTSIDGIDCALVEVAGTGLSMTARVRGLVSRPLGDLAAPTRALADQRPMTAAQIATLARDLALLHVEALKELLGNERADLIVVHGQTVYHKPPVTWQLANPAVVAHAMGAPVLSDLRSADVAAGGEGAPITPLADWIFLRSADEPRVVCNLGGFCNLTFLPPDQGDAAANVRRISGMDVCPCNHLLDRLAQALFGVPFDAGGERATEGAPHEAAGDDLVSRITAIVGGGSRRRSLGTGDELEAWLGAWRTKARAEDLAASACGAIAAMIAHAQTAEGGAVTHLLVAGGGSQNLALMDAIRAAWKGPVSSTDEVGLGAQAREAACMAVLGSLCQDRVPITLPRVTGVAEPAPIAGAWAMP
jgi:1,6-anhydro-N-acetylmuramate kinase